MATYSNIARKNIARGIQNESYILEAAGIRKSAKDIYETAKLNASKMTYELNTELDSMAEEFRRLSSTQLAAAGASGILTTAGSFQHILAETSNQLDREVLKKTKINELNQRTMVRDALLQAEALSVQADAVDRLARIAQLEN